MLKVKESKVADFPLGNGNGASDLKSSENESQDSGFSSQQEKRKENDNTPKIFIPGDNEIVKIIEEKDTEALSTQIAGHSRTGVLKHKTLRYVLKPLQKEPLGSREVGFYHKVNNESLSLHQFIPKFHGVMKIQSGSEWKHYLALEDVVDGYERPCVMDIKIGAQTWDPSAPAEKAAHEKSKYKGTKEPLGLSLTGMQFWDLKTQKMTKMEKEHGKSLVKSTFIEALQEFLNGAYGNQVQNIIAEKLVKKLQALNEYFKEQREFCYYASSILIAYDATKFTKDETEQSSNNKKPKLSVDNDDQWLRIKMIDFAHTFPMEGKDQDGPDENYMFGLTNLLKIFEDFVQE